LERERESRESKRGVGAGQFGGGGGDGAWHQGPAMHKRRKREG
jgi:hypothetical protein